MYTDRHWKTYSKSDELCADFICDAKMCPKLNLGLEEDFNSVSCVINVQIKKLINY